MTDAPSTGSLSTKSATKCPAHTRAWRAGEVVGEGFPPAELSTYLEQAGTFVWLDLLDPDEEDLAVVTEEFGLHPLAVEDAIHDHQRSKLDRYDTHLFLSMYQVSLSEGEEVSFATSEVGVFITASALITVRKDDGFKLKALIDRWDQSKNLSTSGVGFLLWGLVDHIVDGHSATAETLDTRVEELEDYLFSAKVRNQDLQRQTFALRKVLVAFRRLVLPMREVVNTLIRQDFQIVDQAMQPYYQDVYDHILRVTEVVDSMRDLVQSILEANLSIQSNKMNEVMKQLTAWAAIIAVPTAITGFYGQNVPYPGFGHQWGFWVSSIAILGISGVLWGMFRKNEWL